MYQQKSMATIKNALEEIVVLEVQEQLNYLNQPASSEINISEVAAFALNRLPTLYVSTSRGWLQQRKRAHNELRHQIVSAVQQALLGIRRDPLRKSIKIAADKIETPAHALAKLQKLFNKPSLLWHQVPHVFQDNVISGKPDSEYERLNINDRQRLREVKGYLQRKGSQYQSPQDWMATSKELPNPELNSYILSASYSLTNVLEDLVKQEVANQLMHMEAVLPRKVGADDVTAYVLNRLPAMYATTEQGVTWQTQKAKEQLSNQIEVNVIEALMTLSKTPRRLASPIPLVKFEEDCEQSIKELRNILQRDDITWRNIANLAEYALEQSQHGMIYWKQQWRMLGQIYSELSLQPGDAELSLSQTVEGEILVVKTHTKEAFGCLADNPTNLGISTLRLFPAVTAIELHASFLDFAIAYTREEMAEDGII
jgi:hypothetical protein